MQSLKATLPNPVGINSTYRIKIGKMFKSKRAKEWISASFEILRQSGFVPQENMPYWCSLTIDLYTSRMDIDAPIKTVQDLCMWALSDVEDPLNSKQTNFCKGVSDRWVHQGRQNKYWTSPRSEQRIEIEFHFKPILTEEKGVKAECNRITRELCGIPI